MHKRIFSAGICFAVLSLFGAGCASHARHHSMDTPSDANQGSAVGAVVSQRSIRADDTFAAAPLPEKDPASIPLVLPAKVSVRKVKPWVDDQGQLHRNETITLIEEPTQWNPQALLNPHRAYIPVENQPVLPGTGQFSASAGPIAEGVRKAGVNDKANIWEIYGAENIQILDLPEYDQGEVAKRMVHEQLGPNWKELWDEKAGWVAVPIQQLRPVN